MYKLLIGTVYIGCAYDALWLHVTYTQHWCAPGHNILHLTKEEMGFHSNFKTQRTSSDEEREITTDRFGCLILYLNLRVQSSSKVS